jgi:hypothetical protein
MLMRKKEEFLPVRIAPRRAIVSIMPPTVIRIRIRVVVILSPEVNLFASKKRVGIFQFAKAHYLPSLDFSCDGDFPPSFGDIRVNILLDEDDESSFGAMNLRFLSPIKGALQNDDEGRSVFLIDGFNNLSTPYHNFALRGFWILKNLLGAQRSVCLGSQFP